MLPERRYGRHLKQVNQKMQAQTLSDRQLEGGKNRKEHHDAYHTPKSAREQATHILVGCATYCLMAHPSGTRGFGYIPTINSCFLTPTLVSSLSSYQPHTKENPASFSQGRGRHGYTTTSLMPLPRRWSFWDPCTSATVLIGI